ncbi:MAG: FG-GAP-like repeat-containing protein [Halobacteriales archaeon]|nr:FG-GAP-like repeat-containing protein [Halobacteriales archaeon]
MRRVGASILALAILAASLGSGHGDPPSVGRARYADETVAAGLGSYLHAGFLGNVSTHPIFTEIAGPGACWLDADGDGRLDAYLVNGVYQTTSELNAARQPHSGLWLQGDAGFAERDSAARLVGIYFGCAAADYDNDGHPDVFVTGFGGSVLLRNRGDGAFDNVTAALGVADAACGDWPCWATSATWFDYDRDGCLDLFVDHFGNYDLAHPPPENGPEVAPPQQNRLFHGACGGAFTDVTEAAGLTQVRHSWSSAAADLDDDGWPDLYVSNDGDGNDLLLNQADGTFAPWDTPANNSLRHGMGTAIGDLDLDGHFDVVTTNFVTEANGLFLGGNGYADIGSGQPFDDAVPQSGWAARIADLDNNGWPDLMVVNGLTETIGGRIPSEEPVLLYENLGQGAYQRIRDDVGPSLAQELTGRGAAWGDYDDDGALDVLLMEAGPSPAHLLHARQVGGNALTLDLVGAHAGTTRDAVGARVTVRAPGLPDQVQEKMLGEGFLSSSDPRLHVGLGDATHADVGIRWPDGSTQTFPATANTFLRVTEGDAPVVLRALPVVSISGPAAGQRLEPLAFTAQASAPAGIAGIAWEFPEGTGEGASVAHAFTDVGWSAVRATATDAHGRTSTHGTQVFVTDHLQASLAFDEDAFLPAEQARGNATVRFSNGDPVRGASVHIAIAYSTGLPALDALLAQLPRAVRQVLTGDEAWEVDVETGPDGRAPFVVPFTAPSPTGLVDLSTNHPGTYVVTATGGARGSSFDPALGRFSVAPALPRLS